MTATPFVHLHVHSEYSILDGAIRIDQLINKAAEFTMPAIALTDHGNMFGAIDFYQKATKKGIKPIIGCEIYVAPRKLTDRKLPDVNTSYFHLVLLATNKQGYQNLIKLTTIGYLDGFYYKPRIDKEALAANAEGLIGLSACLHGEIPSLLLQDMPDKAEAVAREYRDIFGADNFFLELMDHNLPEQKKVNRALVKLASKMKLGLVATNDCHYLNAADAQPHDVLLCVQTGKKLAQQDRMKYSSDEFYLKSAEEMAGLFSELPEALANTVRIAERCQLELSFGVPMLPVFSPPEGMSVDDYFTRMARDGLDERLRENGVQADGDLGKDYRQRLETEIEIIKKMGFPGYFLIVWDFINYANQQGVPVGPGRGSAAGSLVAYCLRITNIDPIRYHLVFERFLNPSRISLPDIDIDFCIRGREKIIDYVSQKYGPECVSQIITFGTMAARNVIRDVGRVLEVPLSDVDRIAKLVPEKLHVTIAEALQSEPLLQKERQEHPDIDRLILLSQSLEGLKRHASTHAAAVVISREPLMLYTPLYKDSKGEITTQYDMNALEKLGLLKMDFLGLKTLTVINDTLVMVRHNHRIDIDINAIPEDDPATFKMLGEGKTAGVFQLESQGMTDIVKKMRPSAITDLIALVALYRPGPLGSGMVEDFLKRKHGLIPLTYLLPQLEPILKETYGVILYQEQVMKIASALAGFPMARADELRKAMGKKLVEIMGKHKADFLEGTGQRDIPRDKAEIIFDQMEKFAGYGFNKSHAAAYAIVAYQTAYLKANFPQEYMASLLSSEQDKTDKIVKYINECRNLGITVLPPDVNESELAFSVAKKNIRFGMAAVKNVGISAVQEIIECRRAGGPFSSLYDFCSRIDTHTVNKRCMESLIKAGAFDCFKTFRSHMISTLDLAIEHGLQQRKDQKTGQFSLFGDTELAREMNDYIAPLPSIPEWPQNTLLTNEKESLGFYLTGHPLQSFKHETERFCNEKTSSLKNLRDGNKFYLSGILVAVKTYVTKKNEKMAFINVEDLEGIADITVLPDLYQQTVSILKIDMPVLIKGEMNIIDGNQKIKAIDITPLSQIREKYSRKCILTIEHHKISPGLLKKLKTVVCQHHGPCPLVLMLALNGDIPSLQRIIVNVDAQFNIQLSEQFITDVQNILGDCAINVEF